MLSSRLELFLTGILSLLGVGGVWCLLSVSSDVVSERAKVFSGDGSESSARWPYFKEEKLSKTVTLEVPVTVGRWVPRKFDFYPDGRLDGIWVNGRYIDGSWRDKPTEEFTPARIDFGNALQPGENLMVVRLADIPGYYRLRWFPSPTDPVKLIQLALAVGVILLAGALLHLRWPKAFQTYWLLPILLGIVLRVVYLAATPYHVRCYDLGGHAEYIRHVAMHLSLPDPYAGWETHQAPLYYLICGGWMALTGQESSPQSWWQIQALALALSIACLLISVPMARLLFRGKRERSLFLSILAAFPGLVYVAGRISNDTLFTTVCFLWIWLLLRWWEKTDFRRAVAMGIVAGACILTKNVAFALLAATGASIAAHPRVSFGVKAKHAVVVAGLIVLVAGWYQIPRWLGAGTSTRFMLGAAQLPDSLGVTRSLVDLTMFNPISLVMSPFTSSWSDELRRMYFWEYLYRTALYGEWPWGPQFVLIAGIVSASGLACLLLGIVGAIRAIKQREDILLPVALSGLALVGSVFCYAVAVPFSCNQDFRFISAALVLFAALTAKAAEVWPRVTVFGVGVFALNAAFFVVLIAWL